MGSHISFFLLAAITLPSYAFAENDLGELKKQLSLLDSLSFVLTSLAILLICVGMLSLWIVMIYVRRYLNKRQSEEKSVNPELLAKTRQQLYREIARHESTETLLRETQEYLQSIINSMPSVLIGVNPDGYITHWNLAATNSTNIQAENAIGSHISKIYPDLPVTSALIRSTSMSGEVYTRENIQQGRGSNATFIDLTLYPLINDSVSGAVLQVEDVTKQVRVESMLIQSEKMTSLGEMAAGMAHEINNPLAGILNSAQNIERRTSSSFPKNIKIAKELGLDFSAVEHYLEQRGIYQFLNSIRTSGQQAAQIVTNMLEFSRANYQAHSPYDISKLIDEALELTAKSLELRTSMGIEMPRVEKHIEKDIPLLPCSSTEIKQVLVNLIRNAAQAFQSDEYGPPLDPKVEIEASVNGTEMLINIKDNGPGMAEDVKRHIFEPFFTTKDIGKGTGLGLSVTYFIITEHHRGSIDVDSWPGEGTTFRLRLPLNQTSK